MLKNRKAGLSSAFFICILHQSTAKQTKSSRGCLGVNLLNRIASFVEVLRPDESGCKLVLDSRKNRDEGMTKRCSAKHRTLPYSYQSAVVSQFWASSAISFALISESLSKSAVRSSDADVKLDAKMAKSLKSTIPSLLRSHVIQ